MIRKSVLGSILFGLVSTAVSAADYTTADHSGIYFGPVFDVGYDFGGDKVGTVIYRDGSTQNINSGDGGIITGGAHLRLYKDSPFDIKATVGYKYTSSSASNVDVHLSRVTYELTPNVRLPYGIWIGAGIVHQSAINLYTGDFHEDLDFKDATGTNIELGWRSKTRRHIDYGIAAVYTLIKYEDSVHDKYNADSIGLRFTMNFGWTLFGNPGPVHVQPLSQPLPVYQPQIGVVPAVVLPPASTAVATAPGLMPLSSTARVNGQTVTLSAAHTLRRQPREDSPFGNAIPAGSVVKLDGQIGDFWFVRTASTLGWLRVDELQ